MVKRKTLWLILGVLLIDQITKLYVVNNMALKVSVPLINGAFYITYVQNSGSAFGFLSGYTKYIIVATVILIIVLIAYLRELILTNAMIHFGLSIGLGGALGNLLDRIRLGYVVDFFDIKIWPIFNIADVAIIIGVVLIFIGVLIHTEEGEME